ncbi:MAG: DUF3990 domain-containing protein, partial [Clostridiales Family XIII bacterium]|nr:DUF3990 domain-containing protein [Clostridiales Family XIII bacterium]
MNISSMMWCGISKSKAVIPVNYTELSKPLYHGSDMAVSEIDLSQSVPKKDFGCGFYTTNDSVQAEKFAQLKAKRAQQGKGYVSVFRCQSTGGSLVKKFASADREWFGYGELAAAAAEET